MRPLIFDLIKNASEVWDKKGQDDTLICPKLKPWFLQRLENVNKEIIEIDMNQQETKNNHSTFDSICAEMMELHNKKNHDYGDAFGKTYRLFRDNGQQKMADGHAVGILNHKLERVISLLITGENLVVDECIEDSLLDLASYAIMYLTERRNLHESNANQDLIGNRYNDSRLLKELTNPLATEDERLNLIRRIS